MEYYERFRSLREDNDLTQTEIAEYLGVKQNYYSLQERGQKPFQVNQIQLLCKYYQVSADYILGLAPGLNWPRGKGERKHAADRTKYTFMYNKNQNRPRARREFIFVGCMFADVKLCSLTN